MLKHAAFTFIFLLFFSTSYSQILKGVVTETGSGIHLPYVNIGVRNCNGTVSDDHGNFLLDVSSCNTTDTLIMSMIGYESVMMHVSDALQKFTTETSVASMKKTVQELNETVVKSRKTREHESGNFYQSSMVEAGFKSNDLGGELVVRLNGKESGTWIKSFSFYIGRSLFDTLFFRLNVYTLENNKPSRNLLQVPVYITTTNKKGWCRINLEQYNIEAKDDFAIGLEWVRDLRKQGIAKGLYFSAGFLGKTCYYRKASQQEWEKIPVSLGFFATVAD